MSRLTERGKSSLTKGVERSFTEEGGLPFTNGGREEKECTERRGPLLIEGGGLSITVGRGPSLIIEDQHHSDR